MVKAACVRVGESLGRVVDDDDDGWGKCSETAVRDVVSDVEGTNT